MRARVPIFRAPVWRVPVQKRAGFAKLALAAFLMLSITIARGPVSFFPQPSLAASIYAAEASMSASSDDAYHTPGGWPDYNDRDTVVYAGAPGGNGPTWGGWRFTGLDLPANAVIVDAYVELTQAEWGEVFTTTLALEDSPSPSTFSPESSPAHRWQDRTDFQVRWTWAKSVPGSRVRTPSLANGIQELLNSYGAIDSVVLLESGEGVATGQYHSWASFDADPALAPRLHVEYTAGGVSSESEDPRPEPVPTLMPTPTSTPAPTPTPLPVIASSAFVVPEARTPVGGATEVALVLDNAPYGVSGFDLVVTLDGAGIARITSVLTPDYGVALGEVVSDYQARVRAADVADLISQGDTNVVLAWVKVQGVSVGSTKLNVRALRMDDDRGLAVKPAPGAGTIRVLNVPPAVELSQVGEVEEGQAFSASGSFTDAGNDTWTATVDYGDGSGQQRLELSDKSFSLRHVYADNGDYRAVVTVTDASGDSGSAQLSVKVLNVAPRVEAGQDVTLKVGEELSRQGAFADPGADGWTATVDYGDGSGARPLALDGNSFTLGHVYSAAGEYTVTVTVSDDDGGTGSATFVATVAPYCPTLPGVEAPAQDLDSDGLCEDVNGNGRLDFADVRDFFRHLDSPEVQGNPQAFDFSGNGRVDMTDVKALFRMTKG